MYVRSDYLSCVVIADQDYPARVAHTLMNKVGEKIALVMSYEVVDNMSMFLPCSLEISVKIFMDN